MKRFIMLALVALVSIPAIAQNAEIRIRGRVVDEQNLELIGAAVMVQGTVSGTVTDEAGRFDMTVKAGDNLEVSSIGYETYVFSATPGMDNLIIVLKEDKLLLSESVVVGYGTQSKAKLTGAVATVSTDDFKNRPITDVSVALQGKVTGVSVVQNSGQPGADAGTIIIRGTGTLNDSSPLVIVDGFESSFDKVDSKDIESISVLKDAASAAIYGNKAANGVILITTKSGKSGRTTVEYNGYVSVQQVTRYPELLGSVDYMNLYNEACVNSGLMPQFTEEYIAHFDGTDNAMYPSNDWADFYFKPAILHNHYIKFNGGGDKVAYSVSAGYLDQDGIVDGTDYSKFSFRANTNGKFFHDRLTVSTNISGYYGLQNDLIYGAESTIGRIVKMTPMTYAKIEGVGWTDWFYDDAVLEAGGYKRNKVSNFNGNVKLNLKIIEGLYIDAAFNFDQTIDLGTWYAPNVDVYKVITSADGSQHISINTSNESFIRESTYRHGNISGFVTANFNRTFGHHTVTALLGWQQSQWFGKYYQTERSRLTTNLPSLPMGDPASQKNSAWASDVNNISYFGRVGYDYKSKYIAEANVRYDGSSKFAKGHKWGFFPSMSFGGRISEEGFMQDVPALDELKIRASVGQLGNEKIWSSYAGIDILGIGNSNYIWENQQYTGASTTYIANKDLTWETTTQYNVGVDVALFKSLTLTANFYVKRTDDILMQLPVSGIFGFMQDPWKNAGSIRNVGCEVEAGYSKYFGEVGFNAGINFTFNRNTVLDLHGQSPIINNNTGILLKEGLPVNSLYGYEIEGIYQNDAEIHDHLQTFDRFGNPVNSYSGMVAQPGDIRYKDQNGDGIIDLDHDRVALGDPSPDFLYAFNLGLNYRGFDISAFFQGVAGGEGWSTGELVSPFFNGYNTAAWMKDRWTPEKPNNTYQRVFIDNQRATIKSEYYVENMSYLRLKNLELGYRFPDKWMDRIRIDGIRVYLSAQNLFTVTDYKGFDPERAGVEATNIYSYPLVQTFTAGVNITF